MKRIVALVGVRGAGKSTLLRALEGCPHVKTLQPTTDRPARGGEEEYEFVDRFPRSDAMAWEIEVGGHSYGVRWIQVKAIPNGCCGVTVFDPASISVLEKFREQWDGEVVTVGLDTIATVAVQTDRVGDDPSRRMTEVQLASQREQVLKSDIVLRGDADVVKNATLAVCELLVSRGGLIGANFLQPLIKAGALLDGGAPGQIQPASYDLRLGSELWCQGKKHDLTDQHPFFRIPPYSYAIVKAQETAAIPGFMAGRFDLTVSLFFKGVVLSNGPQVDPGYRGALFCMLFNGRDAHADLKKGDHFVTMEFRTLVSRVDGYLGQYQGKKDLNDFLIAETGAGPGGDLVGRIGNVETQLASAKTSAKGYWLAMAGIFVAVLGIAVTFHVWTLNTVAERTEKRLDQIISDAERNVGTMLRGVSETANEAQAKAAEEKQKVSQVGTRVEELNRRIDALQQELDAAKKRSSVGDGRVPTTSTYNPPSDAPKRP